MAPIPSSTSARTKTTRGIGLSPNVILLLVCCFLTLGITVLHALTLDTLAFENDHLTAFVSSSTPARPLLPSDLRISHLTCDRFGGPSADISQEMVYWQDIPSDSKHKSPFLEPNVTRYMTFEPDEGGFNNVRMAMETVLTLAHASGRTLVLPPQQQMYLLYRDKKGKQRREFTFNDFFPMGAMSDEEDGLDIITMEEFLRRSHGRLKDQTGQVSYPPFNRTSWDGFTEEVITDLQPWQQSVSYLPDWDPEKCLAAFPGAPGSEPVRALQQVWDDIETHGGFPPTQKFVGRPVPVHGSSTDRLKENARQRERLCIYDEAMQKEPLIHFHGKNKLGEGGGRLLVHFYGFLFFDDWRQDLWTKRFVRDHVRYVDEIQCAAARVVHAVRERAREKDAKNTQGLFDAFHIRRGEFQYKRTRIPSSQIYGISKDKIPDGTTVYVATDERKKEFFDDMAEHYDVIFLHDYKHLLGDLNTNFYGLVDQLVASRSRVFFGCWFSTFTSYINRLRGYHSDRLKLPGFATGVIASYYYAFPEHKMRMREYWPVSGAAAYAREFPTSWRNIDQGIGELSS